jgi:hypothetical protein
VTVVVPVGVEPLVETAQWAMREANTREFLRACRAAGYKKITVMVFPPSRDPGAFVNGFFDKPSPRPEGVAHSHNIGPRGAQGDPAIWAIVKQYVADELYSTVMHHTEVRGVCRVNPGDYDLTEEDSP